MREMGWVLIVLGVALLIGAIAFDTTVETYSPLSTELEGGTYNIGLMQIQMMIWEAGLAAVLGGVVLVAAGVFQPVATTRDVTASAISAEGVQCAWCDARMSAGSQPCSSVTDAQWPEIVGRVTNETCLRLAVERRTALAPSAEIS